MGYVTRLPEAFWRKTRRDNSRSYARNITMIILFTCMIGPCVARGAYNSMEGRSHLLVGLTAGVVLDSVVHLTGGPLKMAKTVFLVVLVQKAVEYLLVGFGSLLPAIENVRST